MVDRLGVHRFDDADVVGDGLHVRQQVADPGAVLAAAAAGPHRGDDGELRLAGGHAGEALVPLTDGGSSLPWICWSVGLLSKRSTCEKPSLWKRQRTRLALGAKWGSERAGPSPAPRAACELGGEDAPARERAARRARCCRGSAGGAAEEGAAGGLRFVFVERVHG